ncbi:hypothetical protein [Streptomyces sp. NPDC016845]|uniref:hypothetical protein n=1 Tax=Streptomyces sp. NPDC016845 TaxID=3364972 RepID=UPI0037BA6DEA
MEDSTREDRLLMLAITGEPLPGDVADDPDAAAVVADVTLLREQINGLGGALAARPAPAPKPVRAPAPAPAPVRRRRPLRIALGGLVAACAVTVFGGMVWLGVQAPGGASDKGVSSDSGAAGKSGDGSGAHQRALHLACLRWSLEGTVKSVTPRADGDVEVVLEAKRYYRPERSAARHPTVSVTLDGSARADLKPGTYTLIAVPLHPQDRQGRQDWATGPGVGDARDDILAALPEARGLTCPGPQAG